VKSQIFQKKKIMADVLILITGLQKRFVVMLQIIRVF